MRGRAPKVTEEIRQAMQADRDTGMTILEIARKYGVSGATVAKHTVGSDHDSNIENKASWPEWKQWDILNRKYGRKDEKNEISGKEEEVEGISQRAAMDRRIYL